MVPGIRKNTYPGVLVSLVAFHIIETCSGSKNELIIIAIEWWEECEKSLDDSQLAMSHFPFVAK